MQIFNYFDNITVNEAFARYEPSCIFLTLGQTVQHYCSTSFILLRVKQRPKYSNQDLPLTRPLFHLTLYSYAIFRLIHNESIR